MEEWKPVDIPEVDGLYEVSNEGRVRSKDRSFVDGLGRCRTHLGAVMGLSYFISGYQRVKLRNKEFNRTVRVHRLVATAFIPNPDEKPQVNHIDGDRTNNHVDNLEWCTPSENLKHAYRIGLQSVSGAAAMAPKRGGEHTNARPVEKLSTSGEVLATFACMVDAASSVRRSVQSVCDVLKGRSNTCAGFKWRYTDG